MTPRPTPRVAFAARTGDSAWDNAHVAWHSPSGDVVAVFAGLGAQGGGSVLARWVLDALSAPPTTSVRERAAWPIEQAHAVALARVDPPMTAFGTMASLAWGDDAFIAHVGDARVYRLRLDTFECLTRDDVAGDTEPLNHMLTNAVGTDDSFDIHVSPVDRRPGDVFVCCTSTVYGHLGDARLRDIVATLREAAPAAVIAQVAELAPRTGSAVAVVLW